MESSHRIGGPAPRVQTASTPTRRTQKIEAFGHLIVGPYFTGDTRTGVQLRIDADDGLNHDFRARHVKWVRFEDAREGFRLVSSFDDRAPNVYRLRQLNDGALYVMAPDIHVPKALVEKVAHLSADDLLTHEGTVHIEGRYAILTAKTTDRER